MPDDEILDLVDAQDQVIGQTRRSDVYRQGLRNFRVVNAFLVNSQGQLWIPRRSPHKRLFPSCLDVSVGGHVEQGESYETAFRRELQEELNLSLERVQARSLGYLTPYRQDVSAFMQVYEIRSDASPDYNRQDFVAAFWLEPQELLSWISQGEPAKSDLPKLVQRFYSRD